MSSAARGEAKLSRTGKVVGIVRKKQRRPSALVGAIPTEKAPPRPLATPGLWADGPVSVFSNSRALYTQDPTEHEQELTKFQRAFNPLREKNKGRVIL